MSPSKKISLPPKPTLKVKKPAAPAVSQVKHKDLQNLKAVEYRILLDDGTYLIAKGPHADLIYRYLNECEKHCAENQLVNYLGPSLARHDAEGNLIAQGPAAKPGMLR